MILEDVLRVVLLDVMANTLDWLFRCPLLGGDLPIEQILVNSAMSSEDDCGGWREKRSSQSVKHSDTFSHKLSQVPSKGGAGRKSYLHCSIVSRATKVPKLHSVGDGLDRRCTMWLVQVFCKAENGVQRRRRKNVRADVFFGFKSSFCVGSEVGEELPGLCFVGEMLACVHRSHSDR